MLTPYLMAKNMFDELTESAFSANTLRGMMNTDIKESDQGYELDIDLPGVHKENLAAELKDGFLCISAISIADAQRQRPERAVSAPGTLHRLLPPQLLCGRQRQAGGYPRQVRGRHPASVHSQGEPGGADRTEKSDCH